MNFYDLMWSPCLLILIIFLCSIAWLFILSFWTIGRTIANKLWYCANVAVQRKKLEFFLYKDMKKNLNIVQRKKLNAFNSTYLLHLKPSFLHGHSECSSDLSWQLGIPSQIRAGSASLMRKIVVRKINCETSKFSSLL